VTLARVVFSSFDPDRPWLLAWRPQFVWLRVQERALFPSRAEQRYFLARLRVKSDSWEAPAAMPPWSMADQ